MEIKSGTTSFKVPVSMFTSADAPVTGLTFSNVSAFIQKQDGASASKTLHSLNFVEINSASFPGIYDLELSGSELNTIGFLKYTISGSSGAQRFIGIVEVVANVEADSYKILSGRWKINSSTNVLTFYDTDGTTALKTFDLKDSAGSATSTSIFERVPT